jgi:KaiC/GvpD/RAD55 family RecA-like ATPase
MYDLGDVVPDSELRPGTNVLISGPPLTGKRRLALDILVAGSRRGEGSLVVTTKDAAGRIVDEYEDVGGEPSEASLGIVDCVTKQQGGGDSLDDGRVKYASSPVDMTGIGITLSEFLEEFYTRHGLERNRILLDSVSTLLMYSDLQTVFRFLHVFTGRVDSADALGVYVMDATAHDEQTRSTLNQLFDGVVKVEESEDGAEQSISVQGL